MKVTALYTLDGGTSEVFDLDVTNLTPEEIAENVMNEGAPVSICHQCANNIDDPTVGDLVAFNLENGRSFYVTRKGEIVEETSDERD